jgi:hypothetical protein
MDMAEGDRTVGYLQVVEDESGTACLTAFYFMMLVKDLTLAERAPAAADHDALFPDPDLDDLATDCKGYFHLAS